MELDEKVDSLCAAFQDFRKEVTADREPPGPPSLLRRFGPAVGAVGGLVALLVILWQGGDYLFQTDPEATAAAALDKDARTTIQTAHTQDMADLLQIVTSNANTNLLQDKDHEHQGESIKRLERRLARQENRP